MAKLIYTKKPVYQTTDPNSLTGTAHNINTGRPVLSPADEYYTQKKKRPELSLSKNNLLDPKIPGSSLLNPLIKVKNEVKSQSQKSLYYVKPGDTIGKIAAKYNTDIDTIKRSNPQIKDINKIWVDDEINLPVKKQSIIPPEMDYRFKDPHQLDEINSTSDNPSKIHLFESTTPTNDYYVVEDKATHIATVYSMGKPIETINTATGKNKGDKLTVTSTGGKGKDANIVSGAGNMSTPAGMFRISSTGTYHGETSFQRSKINEDYNIPSSVHVGYVPKEKEKCNISNGCTRIDKEGSEKLAKYVGKNTRWYILPEDKNSGEYKITGTGLSFVSNNPKELFSEHSKGNRQVDIQIPQQLSNNESLNAAAKELSAEKDNIQYAIGSSSDTYDRLAKLALGIMGRESGYNDPGVRGTLGKISDFVSGKLLDKNSSIGAFQLRKTSIPKDQIRKLVGKNDIGYNDLNDVSTSTRLVMATLYDIYKNIAPRYKSKYPDMTLDEITLAYYSNPQGVIDPNKAELRKKYAKDVINNSNSFRLKYNNENNKDLNVRSRKLKINK